MKKPPPSCISKHVLGSRIPDEEVLAAIARVAQRRGGVVEMLVTDRERTALRIGDSTIAPVVTLQDLIDELQERDPAAVRFKGSSMMMRGLVVGCFCGTLGQCCKVGVVQKKKEPRATVKATRGPC